MAEAVRQIGRPDLEGSRSQVQCEWTIFNMPLVCGLRGKALCNKGGTMSLGFNSAAGRMYAVETGQGWETV